MFDEAKQKELLEKLAELEHIQWAHWKESSLKQRPPLRIYDPVEINRIEKWNKQIRTDYADLSEDEKELDRKWARKVLKLFDGVLGDLHHAWCAEAQKTMKELFEGFDKVDRATYYENCGEHVLALRRWKEKAEKLLETTSK